MSDELRIISESELKQLDGKEVAELINQIMEESKDNIEEISILTLECTTLLASADIRSSNLSNQSRFKRILNSITGKNRKIRDAIVRDQTNALYAAQEMINRVMRECNNNTKLMYAVNERINDIYIELKANQNEISYEVLKVRKAISEFYKKYQEDFDKQIARINRLEEFEKSRCPECNKKLEDWSIICPFCGCIHPLKADDLYDNTKKSLEYISSIIQDDSYDDEIVWDMTARKTARILKKVDRFAQIGSIKYPKELKDDMDELKNMCKTAEFQIAIVGVMKAGKSFLMNSLIGHEIASVQDNPETATLTKFRSAKGYYLKLKFHNVEEWEKLKKSAANTGTTSDKGLQKLLNNPDVKNNEKKWIGMNNIIIECKDIYELKEKVKKVTSSESISHIFVSEAEVGIDESIFKMPKEVVFVDTPGLQDPVKYRSDITRKYIKRANAVLIAVPMGALTVEGIEVITTVLDCTDSEKALIVATQKDIKNNDEDCEKIVSLWAEKLADSKRYSSIRMARSRIIMTSAKMNLLLNKWINLTDEQRVNDNEGKYFSNEDYSSLESYVKKVIGQRSYALTYLPYDKETIIKVINACGIEKLRDYLEDTLISKYRNMLVNDIVNYYKRCKNGIIETNNILIKEQLNYRDLAEKGEKEIEEKMKNCRMNKETLLRENQIFKHESDVLIKDIISIIDSLT